MDKKIIPLCTCEKCGADVTPTKADAGRFLLQFRKNKPTAEQLREYGKMGGRPPKNKDEDN